MPGQAGITETAISKAIRLVAAFHLAAAGKRVVIIEKRLTPGGGIWGGAMGMERGRRAGGDGS
jgi:ribulose 1,5-bisphosphate synthetase/thiazole synthase